ncbi:MAG: hypothetical protein AAGI66_07770 [Cyanobacteria bacterium P01_H01_bin.74]
MYRGAVNAQKNSQIHPVLACISSLARFSGTLFGYTASIVLIFTGIQWAGYAVFSETFFNTDWMPPLLSCFGLFFGGVFIRQWLENASENKMALFGIALVSLCVVTGLIAYEIQVPHAILPQALDPVLSDYLWGMPCVGLLGMVCYHYFVLKP